MKKLLTACFVFFASFSFAQITFQHNYTTSGNFIGWAQTGPSTWNYYCVDAGTIYVYDINNALVISKPVPSIPGFIFSGISYVSNNLYNLSGNWAWTLMYLNNISKPYEYLLTVYDQTGTQLLRVDSCIGSTIFNSGSGTRMICHLEGITKGVYGANIYTLGGTYYLAIKPIDDNNSNSYDAAPPYPNPSNSIIHLAYNLPTGNFTGEMFVTNISGQVVKTFNIGPAFNEILLDTQSLPAGVYFYHIQSGSFTSPASKFIVSKQ